MNLSTQTAFVTGASRGIGRALVHALLKAGVQKVYATARSRDTLAQLPTGPRIVPLQLDVTDEAAVAQRAASARDVTLLINNAGVLDFGSVLDAPMAAFERNFATNCFGLLHLSRAFAPAIESNGGGGIVNVLTLVALASMPGLGVYNASKAAAWSLTQSLRADLYARNVEVYAVFPGAVDTDMLAGVDMPKASPADVADALVRGLAAGSEDIFPDAMSCALYEQWKLDHKAVEKQFATM